MPNTSDPNRPLTPKEQKAIDGRLAGKTEVDAFRDAGFSAGPTAKPKTWRNRACEFFKKPKIAAYMERVRAKATERAEITQERVLRELAAVGFSRATDFMRILDGGEPAVDLSDLTDEQKAALAEVMVEDFTDGRGDDARDVRRVKFKLHDKLSALDKIARLMKWYEERHVHTGPDGGPVAIIEREIIRPKAKASDTDR